MHVSWQSLSASKPFVGFPRRPCTWSTVTAFNSTMQGRCLFFFFQATSSSGFPDLFWIRFHKFPFAFTHRFQEDGNMYRTRSGVAEAGINARSEITNTRIKLSP